MEILDILILGSGPAALCLASELAKQDLSIKGISTKSPHEKWENIGDHICTDICYIGALFLKKEA
jgi:thioredoxin reductase